MFHIWKSLAEKKSCYQAIFTDNMTAHFVLLLVFDTIYSVQDPRLHHMNDADLNATLDDLVALPVC
jgi:hypothetical protein